MQQTTVTPSLFFDRRGCADGVLSVKYSIYFNGTQRLIATGILLDEKDVKFIQSYRKACLRNLSKGKELPKIADQEQKYIWELLYTDFFRDPESGDIKVGYLKRAQDVIKHLGNNFDFALLKNYLANFQSFLEIVEPKGESKKLSTNADIESDVYEIQESQSYVVNDMIMALMARHKYMHHEERYGTGDSFKDAAKSLFRFYLHYRHEYKELYKKDLGYSPKFELLTESFLNKYERWMYRFGKSAQKKGQLPTSASPSTVGMYTRNFRTVYNIAIKEGIVDAKSYPFGKGKYVIPNSRNIKKARTIEEIEKIISFPCQNESDLLGRDMWLFSYLANGANMADILRIRWRDLDNDTFSFLRKKTINTKKKDCSSPLFFELF